MRKPRTAKPAINLWLIDNSDRLGLTPDDIAIRLDLAGSTVRGWEAGRPIGENSITHLEGIFGATAPDRERRNLVEDQDVAAAIRDQTAAIDRLAQAMERQAEAILAVAAGQGALAQDVAAIVDPALARQRIASALAGTEPGPTGPATREPEWPGAGK